MHLGFEFSPSALAQFHRLKNCKAMALLFIFFGCDNVYDSWSSLGDSYLQEKLARYLRIFAVKSQEDLTQALGLVTDGKVPLDKNGAQQWPKVGDSADFLLTPAACTSRVGCPQRLR